MCQTQPGQKSTWWHAFSRSSTGICTTMHINAGRFASTRMHVGRVNRQMCNHDGWTTHSSAVLRSTTQFFSSAHQEQKVPSIQVKNSWPNHAHELHNKTLWWPQDHGSGPNTTNLVHPRTPIVELHPRSCKNSALVFGHPTIRGLLEHVGNHGSTDHFHAVPDVKRENTDSRTHKKGKTTHEHIAHRLPLDEACTRLNKKEHGGRKNDRRHDSRGSNFSRDVSRTTSCRPQTTGLDVPTACTTKRCGCHIVMTMVRSQLGGTHPHAPKRDVEKTCALTRIVFLPPSFSQVTKTAGNHGGPAKELQCK